MASGYFKRQDLNAHEKEWHIILSQNLSQLRHTQTLTDVTFRVGVESKSLVYAHKLLLISMSPVFYAMFEGPLAENDIVNITDIEEEDFMQLIRYIYGEGIDLSEENVEHVLYAAEKYDLQGLTVECERFLRENLGDNVHALLALEMAFRYSLPELKTQCLELINQHAHVYLRSPQILSLSQEALAYFTAELLDVPEIDVFRACLHWSEVECKRHNLCICSEHVRKLLGSCLFNIRFSQMSAEEFKQEVCSTSLLTPAEEIGVLTSPKPDSCTFSNLPRLPSRSVITGRFQDADMVEAGMHLSLSIFRLRFKVRKFSWLKGLVLYRSVNCPTFNFSVSPSFPSLSNQNFITYQFHVRLIHKDTTLASQTFCELSSKSNLPGLGSSNDKTFEAHFKELARIEPDTVYSIVCEVRGFGTWMNAGPRHRRVAFGMNEVDFIDERYTAFSVPDQIPGLIFAF